MRQAQIYRKDVLAGRQKMVANTVSVMMKRTSNVEMRNL